jgi:hypothetical protein
MMIREAEDILEREISLVEWNQSLTFFQQSCDYYSDS